MAWDEIERGGRRGDDGTPLAAQARRLSPCGVEDGSSGGEAVAGGTVA